MTDPITLTERERQVWHQLARVLDPGDVRVEPARAHLASAITDWLANQPTESASPSRVPVSSAHPAKEGVESGPGRPIEYTTAREQDRSEGFRAGIEAAAECARAIQRPDAIQGSLGSAVHNTALRIEAAIRALADAPAPDPLPDERARCLAIVQRHIDAKVHATFGPNATLQDAFAVGCEMTAKAIYDDIGGTQRFCTPIENIDGDVQQVRFDAEIAQHTAPAPTKGNNQ